MDPFKIDCISFLYKSGADLELLIWVSVELCQVEHQTEVPPWLVSWDKIFKIVDNSGQHVSTFLSNIDEKIKRLEYYEIFVYL